MNLHLSLFLLFLLALPPPLIQQQSSSEQIDIPALLRESEQYTNQNCIKRLERLGDYTYKVRSILRARRKDGTVEEESTVQEGYFVDFKKARAWKRNLRNWVLLEKDGQPIAPDKIEKERRKLAERLAKEEERPPDADGKVATSCQWEGKYIWLTSRCHVRKVGLVTSYYKFHAPALLTLCEFHTPQRETVEGRPMIALNFQPRLGAVFEPEMQWAANAEGRIWIDAEDKVIVAVALWPRKEKPVETSAAYLRQMAAVFFAHKRIKKDLWFIGYQRFDASRFPETATIWKKEIITESFDHIEFVVQAEKEKLSAPAKAPPE